MQQPVSQPVVCPALGYTTQPYPCTDKTVCSTAVIRYSLSVVVCCMLVMTQKYWSKRHPGRGVGTSSPDSRSELGCWICGADPTGACDRWLLSRETISGLKFVSPRLSGVIAPRSGRFVGFNELHRH